MLEGELGTCRQALMDLEAAGLEKDKRIAELAARHAGAGGGGKAEHTCASCLLDRRGLSCASLMAPLLLTSCCCCCCCRNTFLERFARVPQLVDKCLQTEVPMGDDHAQQMPSLQVRGSAATVGQRRALGRARDHHPSPLRPHGLSPLASRCWRRGRCCQRERRAAAITSGPRCRRPLQLARPTSATPAAGRLLRQAPCPPTSSMCPCPAVICSSPALSDCRQLQRRRQPAPPVG